MTHNLVADIGLIHGAGFNLDGEVPKISRGSRLGADRAASLMLDGSIETIICSGLGPNQGNLYQTSEARTMANYLLGIGIPHHRIALEEESTSAVGNWTHSSRLISDLGAESVIAITARPNIPRMNLIGNFVAERSDFELVGYAGSALRRYVKDYAREAVVGRLTKRFLADNQDTPIDELESAYEDFKSKIGLAAIKRLMHGNHGHASISEPTENKAI